MSEYNTFSTPGDPDYGTDDVAASPKWSALPKSRNVVDRRQGDKRGAIGAASDTALQIDNAMGRAAGHYPGENPPGGSGGLPDQAGYSDIPSGIGTVFPAQETGNANQTLGIVNKGLEATNQALTFGRKKYGLPPPDAQPPQKTQSFDDGGAVGAIPDMERDPMRAFPPVQTTDPDIANAATPTQAPPPQVSSANPMRAQPPVTPQPSIAPQAISGTPPVIPGGVGPGAVAEAPPQGPGAIPEMPTREGDQPPGMTPIMDYLSGAGGDPQAATQLETTAATENPGADPSAIKLAAMAKAVETGGDAAGWGYGQVLRTRYDGFKATAAAAVDGGDLAKAAEYATKAHSNLPDGTNVTFVPTANNTVTATVTKAGSNTPIGNPIQLRPEQLYQFMRGPEGQFDNVITKGAPVLLQQLAQGPGQQSEFGKYAQSLTSQTPGATTKQNVTQEQSPTAQPGDYAAGLEARSKRIFPSVGQETQRQPWMAGETQQAEKNRIDEIRAKRESYVEGQHERALGAIGVADINARSKEAIARGNQLQALNKAEAQDKNNLRKEVFAVAREHVHSDIGGVTDEAFRQYMNGMGFNADGTPLNQPSSATPAQPVPTTGKKPPPGWVKAQ